MPVSSGEKLIPWIRIRNAMPGRALCASKKIRTVSGNPCADKLMKLFRLLDALAHSLVVIGSAFIIVHVTLLA